MRESASRYKKHRFSQEIIQCAVWLYYRFNLSQRDVEKTVKRGDSVALCLDRSFRAVAAMLGVLKAGAAFVPIDPEFPKDRLSYIIQDASIHAVLCSSLLARQTEIFR
jgi:non-ribosomal peptide synthetase component F